MMARGNIHNYKIFLFQFSQNFTTDDVEAMKYILQGPLKASDLEGIDKAFLLFDLLEKRDMLSENNFDTLQELCKTMQRERECSMIEDFKRNGTLPHKTQLPVLKTDRASFKQDTRDSHPQQTTGPPRGPIEQPNYRPMKTTSTPLRHKDLPPGGTMYVAEGTQVPDETKVKINSQAGPNKPDVLSTLQNLPLGGHSPSVGMATKVDQPPKSNPNNSDEITKENFQFWQSSQVVNNTGLLPSSVSLLNSQNEHVQNSASTPKNPPAKFRPIVKTHIDGVESSMKADMQLSDQVGTDSIDTDGPEEVSDVTSATTSVKQMQLQKNQDVRGPIQTDIGSKVVTANELKDELKEIYTDASSSTGVNENNLNKTGIEEEFANDLDEFFKFSVSPDKPILPEDLNQPFSLRSYQEELSRSAIKGDNCIICAPTGSGKTITAAYICKVIRDKHIEAQKDFKALFIVCIRNLVTQQKEAFHKVFSGEEDHVVDALDPTLPIKTMMERCDIIMLTAQTFVNELEASDIERAKNPNHDGLEIKDFDMLIFDECHHTNLKHPYNQCMRIYQRDKRSKRGKLPQIIGMTASLGVGEKENPVEHYIKICANLDCKTIQHVTDPENEKALLQECPVPSVKQIIDVKPRMSKDGFAMELHKMMEQIELTFAPSDRGVADRGTQLYEAWAVNCRIQAERDGDRVSRIKYEALNHFNNALMIYEDLLAKNSLAHLREKFHVGEPYQSRRPEEPVNEEQYLYDMVDDRIDKLTELAEESDKTLNPKLQALVILLLTLNQKGGSTNLAKGILLTRTRFSTQALVDFIREREDLKNLVFPDRLVGQGGEDLTMSDKKQQQVIKRFRGGTDHYQGKNLLVATDVAQEGLDIPTCNYVIRYNFVSNEIGSVQSRGRARAKNSESYLIVTKGSINQTRELRNLRREHLMMEALKRIHALDQNDLEKQIIAMQNKLWEAYMSELKRDQARKSEIKPEDIEIFCKKCTRLLSRASDMLQKGSQYICISEEFQEKIEKRSGKKEDFRLDQIVGNIRCADASCQQTLGPWFKYKNGSRNEGYVLSAKNITFKIKGSNMNVKQWSKLPCQIPVEALDLY